MLKCTCRSDKGLFCQTDRNGAIRPLPTKGTIGGGTLESLLESAETLLRSPDVIDVRIVKSVWREQECFELEFQTKEGVCANRISLYLIFDEG
ncbi:hypothetical protein ACN4EG_05245 [Alkalinema pantanalense CENA528]|uniref:hypothetical protein n=1 Tax=Alkalinema pantanalense TaxID=1620705 RepID=UPI003D6DECE9